MSINENITTIAAIVIINAKTEPNAFLASGFTYDAHFIRPIIIKPKILTTVTPFLSILIGINPIIPATIAIPSIDIVTNNILAPMDKALPLTSPRK